MNNTIIFIGFDNDYEQLDLVELNKELPISSISISKLLRTLIFRLSPTRKLAYYFILKIIDSKIKKINKKNRENTLIILKDEKDYLPIIKKLNYKKIVILRNKTNEKIRNQISNEKVYTFDNNEANKYKYIKYNQYASGLDYIKNNDFNVTSDLVFIGKDKGRKIIVNEIASSLEKYIVRKAIISENSKLKKFLIKIRIKKSNFYSYTDYLSILLSGYVILDIIQDGQSTETMRLIEALAAKRKVITNNIEIIHHELYLASNILYFKNIEDLKINIDEFYHKKFDDTFETKLKKYSGKETLKKIILDNITCEKGSI